MKKLIILVLFPIMIFSSARAQSCDTLFNLHSTLDTLTLLAADTGIGAGYLAGNNIYGDLAKAEAFAVPDSGYYVTSASFYFGYVTINPTDTDNMITIYVWDNTGVSQTGSGAPGNVIDSALVPLREIAKAVPHHKRLTVHFPLGGPAVTTDTIFIGLVLPVTTGDTVALLTNTTSGPDGNGWDLNSGVSGIGWNSYNNDWGAPSGSLGNYIAATICSTPDSSATTSYFGDSGPSVCSNNHISFSDSTLPVPTSWSWSFGDGTYSSGPNNTHVYAAAGTYTVTEIASIDTGRIVRVFIAGTTAITVNGSPDIAVSAIAPTSDTTFGSAYINVTGGTGHYFTTWSTGTIGDTLYGASADTTYYVTATDQNTCVTVDSIVIPYPTGIIQISSSQQVKVYPNPASDVLTLEWSQKSNADISILDLSGRVLSTLTANREMKTVCDIHALATGDYVLRITDRTTNRQESMVFTKF